MSENSPLRNKIQAGTQNWLSLVLVVGIFWQVFNQAVPVTSNLVAFVKVLGATTVFVLFPGFYMDQLCFPETKDWKERGLRIVPLSLIFYGGLVYVLHFCNVPITAVTLLGSGDFVALACLGLILFKNRNALGTLASKTRIKVENWKSSVKTHQNTLLFFLFVLCWSVFNIVRFDLLYGDDPWVHLRISTEIVHAGRLDFTEYDGYLGLHAIGATLVIFANCTPLLVAYYFPLYCVLYAGFLGQRLAQKFFSNLDMSLLTTVVLLVVPLGYLLTLGQFWPTAIAIILGLTSLYWLVEILESGRAPTALYVLIGAQMAFAEITHGLTTAFYLFILAVIWLFYFIDGFRDGKLMAVMLFCIVFCVVFDAIFPSSAVTRILVAVRDWTPAFLVVITLILGGLGVGLVVVLHKFLERPISNPAPGSPKVPPFSETQSRALRITLLTVSIVFPLIIFLVIPRVTSFILPAGEFLFLSIVVISYLFVFAAFGVFQFKNQPHKGKILALWALWWGVAFLVIFVLDFFFIHSHFWIRGMVMTAPAISISAGSLLYVMYRTKKLDGRKVQAFVLVFVSLACVGGLMYETRVVDSKNIAENQAARWLGGHLPANHTLLTGFRWKYIVDYHAGGQLDVSLSGLYYLHPQNHTLEDGQLVFSDFARERNTRSVYLLLEDTQREYGVIALDAVNYGVLTRQEIEYYLTSLDFNRVFSGARGIQVYQFINHNTR